MLFCLTPLSHSFALRVLSEASKLPAISSLQECLNGLTEEVRSLKATVAILQTLPKSSVSSVNRLCRLLAPFTIVS